MLSIYICMVQSVSRKLIRYMNKLFYFTLASNYICHRNQETKIILLYGPAYQLTVILPVCLEPVKSMALGISHQLSDDCVLNPLQEVPQARLLLFIKVLLGDLFNDLVLCLCLSTAGSGRHSLYFCLCSVHGSGLTASLKQQQSPPTKGSVMYCKNVGNPQVRKCKQVL